MSRAVRLADGDDVAVLVDAVEPGAEVLGVVALDAAPSAHKIALHAIAVGATVRKYGQAIGVATRPIAAGEHVHSHNLAVGGERGIAAAPRSASRRPAIDARYRGYVRDDGRAGTRNFIGILSSVNCSATVCRRIAAAFDREPSVPGIDGVAAFTHTSGCGMAKTGEGIELLERTIAGYARHPNFGGVVIIGLGCEVAQIEEMLDRQKLVTGDRLRALTIQHAGGTTAAIELGTRHVRELIELARADVRVERPASDLMLGLQCGGSDGWSGVTANPSLGVAADLLVAAGGTAILSETPEISGAEHLLLARAAEPGVVTALEERLAWWKDYAAKHGADLDNNPSPGNKAGGLTTIFEKSLGAVAKAGASPLMDVRRYAEPMVRHGLVFMDSPGYDPCSATGQIAAGANILAFTTGRGSAFGSKPAPCLKIASNAALYRRMADDMDIDASSVLDGEPVEAVGQCIFDALIEVASGTPTKSEALGLGDYEFVPWQVGAWL
jgi:altronate hydrolase